jgi:exodeoxyribonuclease III
MIGARFALQEAEKPLAVPRPESAISALLRSPSGPLEIHCVHVPNAANGWVKVDTLKAVRRALETPSDTPRVLCGDLNTPRREQPDGTTISFARDSRGRLRAERGPEWDAAELGIVPGLRDLGYRDAFRTCHGYASRSPSWTWKRIAGHDGGWRIDHIFASAQLRAASCFYHHAWRDEGLSDHSALEADFNTPRAASPGPEPSGMIAAGQRLSCREDPEGDDRALKARRGDHERVEQLVISEH